MQPAKGPGDDVRALGSDIAAGEVVLAKDSLIGAAEIGLLATVGAATVQVTSVLWKIKIHSEMCTSQVMNLIVSPAGHAFQVQPTCLATGGRTMHFNMTAKV